MFLITLQTVGDSGHPEELKDFAFSFILDFISKVTPERRKTSLGYQNRASVQRKAVCYTSVPRKELSIFVTGTRGPPVIATESPCNNYNF